jgi:hypothetical protein
MPVPHLSVLAAKSLKVAVETKPSAVAEVLPEARNPTMIAPRAGPSVAVATRIRRRPSSRNDIPVAGVERTTPMPHVVTTGAGGATGRRMEAATSEVAVAGTRIVAAGVRRMIIAVTAGVDVGVMIIAETSAAIMTGTMIAVDAAAVGTATAKRGKNVARRSTPISPNTCRSTTRKRSSSMA